jgi:hypothetical protein
MSKICLPLLDLHRRVLAEIRRMPGCHNVQEIAINCVPEVLTSTGPHVCSLQAAPMPIPRPARRFTSRAFYAGNMIYSLIDRPIHWRGSHSFLPAPQDGNFSELLYSCVACFEACWPWSRSRRSRHVLPTTATTTAIAPTYQAPKLQSRKTDDQAVAGIEL